MSTVVTRRNTFYGYPNPQGTQFPDPIVANRAPTQADKAVIGQLWVYPGTNSSYILSSINTSGQSVWTVLNIGGAGIFSSLQVNGLSTFAGNIVQQAPGVTANFLSTNTTGLSNNGVFSQTGGVAIVGQIVQNTGNVSFTAPILSNTGNSIFQNTGALASLNLQNTDNTQTAGSRLTIQVTDQQAGRVGDAQINFNNDGVWQYAVGLDSSNGQSFSIAIGASLGAPNNIFTSTLQGFINLPKQPCFNYFLNADTAGVTGGGGAPVIAFNTASLGSPYFAAGRFTAPVTGNYLLGASVSVGAVDVAMTEGVLFINIYDALGTPTQIYELNRCNPGAIKSATNVVGFQGQIIAPMNATDYAEITCVLSNGANNAIYQGQPQRKTNFYGQLIS